jgi:hypothetical protein
MNSSFRMRDSAPAVPSFRGVKSFDDYLFVLPGGVGGHGCDPDHLCAVAVLQGWEGWLLGCRYRCDRRGAPRGRLRVLVTPLGMVGTPAAGTIATALVVAGALDGCDYVLPADAP